MDTRNVLAREIVSLNEDDDCQLARQLMQQHDVNHLPVLRHSKVIGIVSDRDLLSLGEAFDGPICDVMSRDLMVVRYDATVADAARLMVNEKIHALPVVDQLGDFVGLVTSTDLLRLLFHQNKRLRDDLPCCFLFKNRANRSAVHP